MQWTTRNILNNLSCNSISLNEANLTWPSGKLLIFVGLDRLVNKYSPDPGSKSGFAQCSLYAQDSVLLRHWRLVDAHGCNGKEGGARFVGIDLANRDLLASALRNDNHNEYTLDIDATAIAAQKDSDRFTYGSL